MTNINPVSNFVSGAGVVSVDIDTLRQLADALKTYARDDIEPKLQQLQQDTIDLPNHWQGSAAHQARAELEALLHLMNGSYQLALELWQGLNAEIFAYLEASSSLYTG